MKNRNLHGELNTAVAQLAKVMADIERLAKRKKVDGAESLLPDVVQVLKVQKNFAHYQMSRKTKSYNNDMDILHEGHFYDDRINELIMQINPK